MYPNRFHNGNMNNMNMNNMNMNNYTRNTYNGNMKNMNNIKNTTKYTNNAYGQQYINGIFC